FNYVVVIESIYKSAARPNESADYSRAGKIFKRRGRARTALLGRTKPRFTSGRFAENMEYFPALTTAGVCGLSLASTKCRGYEHGQPSPKGSTFRGRRSGTPQVAEDLGGPRGRLWQCRQLPLRLHPRHLGD